MFLAGDAIGHTQNGNNNAYCQDNEISWLDWNPEHIDQEFLEFVQKVVALRKEHPVFRRRNFFQGRNIRGKEIKDIVWLKPDGLEMTDEEWNQEFARSLGVSLAGEAVNDVDERGQRIRDDNFLLLMNAHHECVTFVLPAHRRGVRWEGVLDTAADSSKKRGSIFKGGQPYQLEARSLAVLRLLEKEKKFPT